jgi:hypothetical protein
MTKQIDSAKGAERDRPVFEITKEIAVTGYSAMIKWEEGRELHAEGAQRIFLEMLRAGGFQVGEKFVEPGI